MTRREAIERERFSALLCRESGYVYAHRCAELLCRHGKTYARLQEANCNGVGTWSGESNESFARRQERFEKELERREGNLERRIREICAQLGKGFEPVFGGDPRGATVKIRVPSNKTTDWGGEGVCVPTS